LNPIIAGGYIDFHYRTLYKDYIAQSPIDDYLPETFVQSTDLLEVTFLAAALILTGLFALLGFTKLFKLFGIFFVLAAVLLHIPYIKEGTDVGGNMRKLLFVCALLCGILAYRTTNKAEEDFVYETY
jgi:hypothetical protein